MRLLPSHVRLPVSSCCDLVRTGYIRINAQERIDTGSYYIVTDGYCFFGHPFRCTSDNRKLGNVQSESFASSAARIIIREISTQDPICSTGGISASSHTLQTCSAEFFASLSIRPGFCSSLCRTSGSNDNDIVCDHFLHQLDMGCIRSDFRVVTSNHGNCTADNTGCDTPRSGFVVPISST